MKQMNWALVEGENCTLEERDMYKVKEKHYFMQLVLAQFYALFYSLEPMTGPALIDITCK